MRQLRQQRAKAPGCSGMCRFDRGDDRLSDSASTVTAVPKQRLTVPPLAKVADYADVAAELHPSEGPAAGIRARSQSPVRWQCDAAPDHVWVAPPYRRIAARAGCPACAGRQPSVTNSLAALFPDVACELDLEAPATAGLTPDQIVAGSHRRVGWCCSRCGHRWEAQVGPRTGRQRAGCPACAGHVATVTRNLATLRPDLAEQWHPNRNGVLRPETVRPGSSTPVWWQCSVHPDHEWSASPNSRTHPTNPTGCPACSGYQLSATNNLAARYPVIAEQFDPALNGGRTADEVLAGTAQVVTWRCPEGPDHVWRVSVVSRTAQDNGCPCCAGKKVSVTNMLALQPDLAAQFDHTANAPDTPRTLTRNSRKRVTWRCPNGPDHQWRTAVANRALHGHGCPFCAGNQVSITNSLATTCPQAAAQLNPDLNHGLSSHDVTAGSGRQVVWSCPAGYGHTWSTTVAQHVAALAAGGGQCRDCHPFGTGTSLRQLALASALAHALPDLVVDARPAAIGAGGRRRHVDVLIRALHLIIEYDGVFFHQGRESKDAEKSTALRGLGWTVVRLREDGLTPLHPHDLTIPVLAPVNAEQLVKHLLSHLTSVLPPPEAAILLHAITVGRAHSAQPWIWVAPGPRFQRGLDVLGAFTARERHARVPSDHHEGTFPLGYWVMEQRRLHRRGHLPAAQADLLSASPGWVWDWHAHRWQLFLTTLGQYANREGHTRVPQGHLEDGYPLGAKVAHTRTEYRRGKLQPERAAQLQTYLGWDWNPQRTTHQGHT